MTGKPAKRSSLFLLELIITILFFSLASAVCIRFFVQSHTLSQDTEDLNMAVNHVSGCAELFLACDESFDRKEDTYFDKNWTECDEPDAAYTLRSSVREEGIYQIGTFSVSRTDGDACIYSIDVKRYPNHSSQPQEVTQ